MAPSEAETTRLLCGREQRSADIRLKLHGAGLSVAGPAASAARATATAAQTAPMIAVVVTPPHGRDSVEFTGDLRRTWGVHTWIREGAGAPDAAPESWDAQHQRVARLLDILSRRRPPPKASS